MEVECLRMAEGEENVIPLQFVYRHLGDVLLAMPYIECCKFSDVVRTMDHVEVRMYMRHLLRALAHIHNLGIIHRDIKPANFLYDRSRGVFKLVDFGLAQRVGEAGQVSERRTAAAAVATAAFISAPPQPQCKRKLTSSDLANSMESPPPSAHHSKRQKLHHPSGERGASRKVLTDKYSSLKFRSTLERRRK
jgi:serine/threonine protein kinase